MQMNKFEREFFDNVTQSIGKILPLLHLIEVNHTVKAKFQSKGYASSDASILEHELFRLMRAYLDEEGYLLLMQQIGRMRQSYEEIMKAGGLAS